MRDKGDGENRKGWGHTTKTASSSSSRRSLSHQLLANSHTPPIRKD